MKISIITLQNVSNYGSVLQAYATQMFFQSMGYQVEMVNYWRHNMIDCNIAHDLIIHKNLKLKKIWGKSYFLRMIAEMLLCMKIEKQAKPFRKFVHDYLTTTSITYTSLDQLTKNPPIADIYCVGSDQVWNSDWNGGIDESFYLAYAPERKKRISFSSSFGVEYLTIEEQDLAKKYLSNFSIITVREKSAVDLLNKLNIRNAECVLDPTLLISSESWKKLICKQTTKKGKYILVYQLNDNSLFDQAVEEAAKMISCKVIRLEYRRTDKYGEHVVLPSVSEWLTYFYNADYIITDSFHATAFSINFEKQFIDILPSKFGTRILSILELTGIRERKINSLQELSVLTLPIDYDAVTNKLNEKRLGVISLFTQLQANL